MIDLWESLFRTSFALAIVLVLIGIVAFLFRRVMGHRWGTAGERPLVQVVATGYLAPRKSVSLVSVAGEYLIVGTTANDLVPLGRITDASKVAELLAHTTETPTAQTSSIQDSVLASWIRRRQLVTAHSEKDAHGL